MNYCIVAFGVMLLIAGGTWVFDGHRHYTGPQLNVQELIDGNVEGMEPVKGEESGIHREMADEPEETKTVTS